MPSPCTAVRKVERYARCVCAAKRVRTGLRRGTRMGLRRGTGGRAGRGAVSAETQRAVASRCTHRDRGRRHGGEWRCVGPCAGRNSCTCKSSGLWWQCRRIAGLAARCRRCVDCKRGAQVEWHGAEARWGRGHSRRRRVCLLRSWSGRTGRAAVREVERGVRLRLRCQTHAAWAAKGHGRSSGVRRGAHGVAGRWHVGDGDEGARQRSGSPGPVASRRRTGAGGPGDGGDGGRYRGREL